MPTMTGEKITAFKAGRNAKGAAAAASMAKPEKRVAPPDRLPASAFGEPGQLWRDSIPVTVPDHQWSAATDPNNLDLYYNIIPRAHLCDSLVIWNSSQTKRAIGIVCGIDKARGKIKVEIIEEREFAPIDMDVTVPSDLYELERAGFNGYNIRRKSDGVVVASNIKGRPAAEEEMRQLRITHGA
jgi:hypothetical protein